MSTNYKKKLYQKEAAAAGLTLRPAEICCCFTVNTHIL